MYGRKSALGIVGQNGGDWWWVDDLTDSPNRVVVRGPLVVLDIIAILAFLNRDSIIAMEVIIIGEGRRMRVFK